MRRREFITLLGAAGAAAASPLAARAQPRVPHIGILSPFPENDPSQLVSIVVLRQELDRLGWAAGRSARITYRYASSADQFPQLAKEMVALRPDVIFAQSFGMVAAVKPQTSTIPIVFVNVSDPIGFGFVASLARPGGNLTGLMMFEAGIAGKWLSMLKEVAPATSRGLLMANRKTAAFDYFQSVLQPAAASFGIALTAGYVESTGDMDRVVETFAGAPNGGLILLPDSTNFRARDHIVALAAKHRLPAVYPERSYVEAGGLMYYGIHRPEVFRLAATYVDRILRGARPADMPVQVPTRYETVVNLKTAKALGLTVPPGLLVAADEVIE